MTLPEMLEGIDSEELNRENAFSNETRLIRKLRREKIMKWAGILLLGAGMAYFAYSGWSKKGEGKTLIQTILKEQPKENKPKPSLEYLFSFGKKGTGAGQFNSPSGVTIHKDRIYVADTGNGRVQVFDLEGRYQFKFGVRGKFIGQLYEPTKALIFQDKIFVADSWPSVQAFSNKGKFLYLMQERDGSIDVKPPAEIAQNKIYSVNEFLNYISVSDLKGKYISKFGKEGKNAGEFDGPKDIAIEGDKIYVADYYNDRIQIFDLDGRFLSSFGGLQDCGNKFRNPFEIEIDDNLVYVIGQDSGMIHVFEITGKCAYNLEGAVDSDSSRVYWHKPKFAVHKGRIYVADEQNNVIKIFKVNK